MISASMALEDLILKSKNLVLKDNLMCENNYIKQTILY